MNKPLRLLGSCYSGLVRRSWPEGFCLGFLIRVGDRARAMAHRRSRPPLEIQFVDRSRGAPQLVIVLAGYKPDLWPLTLARVGRFVPDEFDVCLASAGRRVEALDSLAEQHGWSYLSTNWNDVSTVQNAVIEEHSAAQFIFKLDEDIFIGRGFFEGMLQGHLAVKQLGLHRPGFSAPVINVNGYGYIEFLRELGLCQDYASRFGRLQQAADKIEVHHNGEAARWLWKQSLPFDDLVQHFAEKEFNYSTCPHRFSIGAILFERSFWSAMGGLAVCDTLGRLGHDEEHLCKYCLNSSEVMVVLHNVFAGHFGFGPQNQVMSAALDDLMPGLMIKPDLNRAPENSLDRSNRREPVQVSR